MSRSILAALMLATAGTLLLSAVLTIAARRVALRIGFVDRPGAHKSHRDPTPYGGGSAMLLSLLLVLLPFAGFALLAPDEWAAASFGDEAAAYLGGVRERFPQLAVLIAGALVVHALGLRDDCTPLAPGPKLAVISATAVGVSWLGDVRVAEAMLGPIGSIALTTAWFIVVVNAMNFLDNMDGLSAGVGAICLATLAICGLLAGQVLVPALAGAAAAAVGGFLVWNFPPARLFMGDAGSLLIGYLLASVSVLTTYYRSDLDTPSTALAMPFVVLAIPLYDFCSVVLIRLREGRNPMRGDQRHFSHRLVDHGLSRRMAVLTIYLATATTGLAATLLPGASTRQTITIAIIVAMVLTIVAILESPASAARDGRNGAARGDRP